MSLLVDAPSVSGAQRPRVAHFPAAVSSAGSDAIECAELAGLVLDPWQRLVVEHALGEGANGKWAAFEVGLCVPRQNGKGGVIEALELAGLFVFGERLVIHSAHEFSTARAAFRRMEDLIAGTPEFSKRVKRISRTNGDEGIYFTTKQALQYRTRTKSGGRGLTGDRVILDEAMILPDTTISALMPTMSARSIEGNPQLCYFGSAVDQVIHADGLVFSRLRARGLAATDPSLAYFEWSVDAGSPEDLSDADAADVDLWRAANPALGIRIAEDHVGKEHRSMDARSFAVERLGVGDWPDVSGDSESVVSLALWRELADAGSRLVDPVVFAFDVSPNRSRASIAACGVRADGLLHAEIVDRRHDTDWVVARLVELCAKHDVSSVVADARGPAASLFQELAVQGVRVDALTSSEHAQACGAFVDAVKERRVRHLGSREMESAIKGASTRSLGDAWAWSRKSSGVDITPLVACTLGLWRASQRDQGSWVGW